MNTVTQSTALSLKNADQIQIHVSYSQKFKSNYHYNFQPINTLLTSRFKEIDYQASNWY